METEIKEDDERVKTYLKVKTCETVDKQYYKISENKQILSLYDPSVKTDTSKTIKFEIDKIFTDKNENSYIVEEIARDCVAEALNGEHFTFMSYGDSLSDKNAIIFGGKDCYKNLNTRGIFPRILDSMLNAIAGNKSYNENYVVNLSYICVNGNKLIDLSKFLGKDLNSVTQSQFITAGIEIKTNPEILQKIKKIQIDNTNEVIFFLSKIFDLLYKLELDSLHLLTWSHFAFVIYINDNSGKVISTLSFIILSCNDILSTKVTNPTITRNTISNTKNVVDAQSTFTNIVKNISYSTVNELDQSKLATVLTNCAFNHKQKRKFRVIGSIVPNTGLYATVKDTLMFLFECKKTVRMRPVIDDGEVLKEDFKKDDVIYDLESKLKAQQNTIKELNERLDYKQKKIEILTENYKKQVEVLKKEFNFTGDVNVLLSGDEYTKEAKYARSVRDAMDTVRIKSSRIGELEGKIVDLREEIKRIKAEQDLKNNDQTMANIYIKLKEDKLAEERKLKMKNEHSAMLEELVKKNKLLAQLNEEYKKEIENKTKMLHNLPTVLKENKEQYDNIQKVKEETKKKAKEHFKKEISAIESNNMKENKKLIEKYENLLSQKENEAKIAIREYKSLKDSHDKEINSYLDELIRLKDTIDTLISSYKKSFDLKKFDSNMNSLNNFNMFMNYKREFDKNLSVIEESLNGYQYPLLSKTLELKGPNRKKTKIVAIDKPKIKEGKSYIEPQRIKKEPTVEEVERKKEILFKNIKPDDEIEKMSQEELISYIKTVHKKIKSIEDYANNYIKYNKGYTVKEFEINEKYVNDLYNKIEKLKRLLDEQITMNSRNKVIISSHERMLERLNSENFLLKNTLNSRALNAKISFPLFTDDRRSRKENELRTFSKQFNSPGASLYKKSKDKPMITVQSTQPGTAKNSNRPMTSIGFYQVTK